MENSEFDYDDLDTGEPIVNEFDLVEGIEAKQILNNPAFHRAIVNVRKQLVAGLELVDLANNRDQAFEIVRQLQLQAGVVRDLRIQLEKGDMVGKALKEQADRQKERNDKKKPIDLVR